jgi:NhaP-type Na+/H+ or K+/H+ antiporter
LRLDRPFEPEELWLELDTAFGLIAGVLVVSALAAGLVERAPLSFPMLFLGLGFLLGDRGLGFISIGLDSNVLEVVAVVALALVLFLDAINLELTELRRDWLVPLLVLGPATLLVIGLLAGLGMLLLGLPVVLALLLGTILASTDPVVLRDVLRDLRIPRSVRRALSVEAGTNDIVVLPILLVLIAVARAYLGGPAGWLVFLGQLFVLGPAAGFAVGAAGSWVMDRVDQRFRIRREYQSLYGIGLVLGAFVAGEAVGGDGFLAAFAAGVAVTVVNQTLCDCFLEFGQVIAEMTMLLAFVLFGALLSTMLGQVPLPATLALAGLAIFVIRPLAVRLVLGLGRAGLSRYARQFIAWFGPRGLNSLLFALLVVAQGVPGGEELFPVVGVVVLVSVVAHGATATPFSSWYARKASQETLVEERAGTAAELFTQTPDDIPRVTPSQLFDRLAGPHPPLILDVRSRSEYDRDGVRIPGSIRVLPDQVTEWAADRLRDQPFVLYCT